ncbi:MAG: hypothetical protein KDA79_17235, partial [Planctomycetaceae bacterium]|nr:hypothetical protein [Planctomycetaceae bacterium]
MGQEFSNTPNMVPASPAVTEEMKVTPKNVPDRLKVTAYYQGTYDSRLFAGHSWRHSDRVLLTSTITGLLPCQPGSFSAGCAASLQPPDRPFSEPESR